MGSGVAGQRRDCETLAGKFSGVPTITKKQRIAALEKRVAELEAKITELLANQALNALRFVPTPVPSYPAPIMPLTPYQPWCRRQ